MPLLVSDLSQWSGRAVAAISTMRKGRAGVHGFYEPHPFFVSACVIRPIRRPVEGVADSTYPAVLVIWHRISMHLPTVAAYSPVILKDESRAQY